MLLQAVYELQASLSTFTFKMTVCNKQDTGASVFTKLIPNVVIYLTILKKQKLFLKRSDTKQTYFRKRLIACWTVNKAVIVT